ncbi:MAG: hypothetical protein CM15mP49_35650 [Actinomycetota bacterium]|nr:MAG: hypothetical protein CM15mP49_35650 [Actinomycetota bacterium]
MGWVEAVRFGETMRIVANQTEDATEAEPLLRRNESQNGEKLKNQEG